MSHAVYSFYVVVNRDEEIKDQIEEAWASFDDRLDENNWYTLLSAVTEDNQEILFSDDGSMHFGNPMASKEDQGDTLWEKAWRFAIGCVANDIGVGDPDDDVETSSYGFGRTDKPDTRTFNEVKEAILRVVPQRLSKLYARGSLLPSDFLDEYHTAADPDPNVSEWLIDQKRDLWMARYERGKWATQFEHFLHSIEWQHNCPFTSDSAVTPYDYRAFDISGYDDIHQKEDNSTIGAILFVDVHT